MPKTSLHAFKAKDTRFVADWLKSKGWHKLVLYLKVFKNHLYYLWHVRVLSIKSCLHTQLPEHIKSYRKVSRGWGHLITFFFKALFLLLLHTLLTALLLTLLTFLTILISPTILTLLTMLTSLLTLLTRQSLLTLRLQALQILQILCLHN